MLWPVSAVISTRSPGLRWLRRSEQLGCVQAAVAESKLAVAVQAAEQVADSMVHRMLVELETGGNIRYLIQTCM